MQYIEAPDIRQKLEHIVRTLGMDQVDLERVACFRSRGTSTRRTIARCHGLPKVMQLGMGTRAFYVIELISERFDKLSEDEQTEVLLHELMHIPKNFGGGFRKHDYVCSKEVKRMHRLYKEKCGIAGSSPPWEQLKSIFKMNAER